MLCSIFLFFFVVSPENKVKLLIGQLRQCVLGTSNPLSGRAQAALSEVIIPLSHHRIQCYIRLVCRGGQFSLRCPIKYKIVENGHRETTRIFAAVMRVGLQQRALLGCKYPSPLGHLYCTDDP